MKKIYVTLTLLTILCLVSLALADEASYYYGAEDWLIRAYTDGSNVYLEVRDTSNNLVNASSIVGMTGNPQLIANNSTTENVSLSFDPSTATAYIFYTTGGGLQLATINDVRSGGPHISVNPTSVNFGSVTVGASSDQTVTVSNTGTDNLVLGSISVTGTYFSRQGGTCAANGQTLTPGASCTIIVRFSPGASGTFNGNLAIPSNDVNVNVPLSGTGVTQGGNADLIISSLQFLNCCDNNKPFTVNITVKNQGTGDAGPFTVKGYISSDTVIGAGDQLVFTWNVGGLSAGSSISTSGTGQFSGYPIHEWYWLIFIVDANNQVPESNENNNTRMVQFLLTR